MASHGVLLSGKSCGSIAAKTRRGCRRPTVLTVRAAIHVSASEVSAPPYGRQLPSEPLDEITFDNPTRSSLAALCCARTRKAPLANTCEKADALRPSHGSHRPPVRLRLTSAADSSRRDRTFRYCEPQRDQAHS